MSEKHIKPQNNDKVLALKFRQLTLIKLKEKNRYYLLTGPHCQDVTQGQFFFSFSFFFVGSLSACTLVRSQNSPDSATVSCTGIDINTKLPL